jgi:hypothetical protein
VSRREVALPLLIYGGIILVVAVFGVSLEWYQAGVKAAMYHRNGIEVSQWEVFCGATPPARILMLPEARP